jgi:hypothetical protein
LISSNIMTKSIQFINFLGSYLPVYTTSFFQEAP